MADSNEEEENQETSHFLNLPPPTTFSLASIHDPLPNPPKQPLIFPPNNHENLLPLPSPSTASSCSSSLSSYPSSSWDDSSAPTSPIKNLEDPSGVSGLELESLTQKVNGVSNLELDPLTKKVNGVSSLGRWNLELRLGALTRKVNGVVVCLRRSWIVRGVLSIFRSPVGHLMVLLLYLRWRRRGSVGVDLSDGSYRRLLRVIREKDERINELLNQIARMNEVLLSVHKVPSSKAG